jgi:hypothetical protein
MSENSLLSSAARADKNRNTANGRMMPYLPRRRRLRVSRALSHAKDEKAFQDAVRTGRFTERELQTLEEEFQKVHRRRPRRP